MRGVTLIGMPGAGKSTIGRQLAERLGWRFLDLDALIKEKEGRSHADIAAERGDAALVKLEEGYTLGLDLAGTVFSPGGSVVYSAPAMAKLGRETLVVYLALPLAEIGKRLGKNLHDRGVVGLKEKGLAGVYAEREPLYQKHAHHVINCLSASDAEVVQKIHALLQHQ